MNLHYFPGRGTASSVTGGEKQASGAVGGESMQNPHCLILEPMPQFLCWTEPWLLALCKTHIHIQGLPGCKGPRDVTPSTEEKKRTEQGSLTSCDGRGVPGQGAGP